MKDIYRSFENFENERYLLRAVTMADAPALLRVYSDEHALPFFNSDNCHGDNFYYTTLERMQKAIDFWQDSYDNGWFVRWCIADKAAGQVIGTVELFTRSSDDAYDSLRFCGWICAVTARKRIGSRQFFPCCCRRFPRSSPPG